jgi:hypothetical protein
MKMKYLIVNSQTLNIKGNSKSYSYLKSAQKEAARLNKIYARDKSDLRFCAMSQAEYNAKTAGKGEWKRNLMNGKLIWVAHDTPLSCDPSSETYWSM